MADVLGDHNKASMSGLNILPPRQKEETVGKIYYCTPGKNPLLPTLEKIHTHG